jgi:cyclophilin family peptidyl-prolyl cis-trans isomerase
LHRIEWKPLGGKVGMAAFEFRIELRKTAIMLTDVGKVNFTLFYDKAPRNVENFLELARDRRYDGSLIHRILPTFMQGGKPVGGKSEKRPDGKTVPAEFHDAPFDAGTLAMALAVLPGTDEFDANSASCQFIVGLSRSPSWDGVFTVIGQASDEESHRTLRALSETRVDANGRPLQPVKISFHLADIETPRTTEKLELGGR